MMMKRLFAPLALLSLPFMANAQDLPATSPSATLKQRIGLTDITIEYSRPSAKGRRVFGDLVPYGQLWRTGANHCTTVEVSGNVSIGGHELPGGKYSLFTVPNEGAWELVINRNTDLWGTEGYNKDQEILRMKVPARPAPSTETFCIAFENLGMDRGDLVFRWEKLECSVEVEADATKQGMANIVEALAKPDANSGAYARAAGFCLDRHMEPKSALAWARKSVELEKKYWNTFYLARAQAELQMYEDAVTTGKEAVDLAIASKDAGAQKTYEAKVAEWAVLAKAK